MLELLLYFEIEKASSYGDQSKRQIIMVQLDAEQYVDLADDDVVGRASRERCHNNVAQILGDNSGMKDPEADLLDMTRRLSTRSGRSRVS